MRLKGLRKVIDPPEGATTDTTTASTTPAATAAATPAAEGGDDNNGGGATPVTAATAAVDDAEKNAEAYAELIQFLDERSLSLVMRDAEDDGRAALEILKEHTKDAVSQEFFHYIPNLLVYLRVLLRI